MNKTLDDYFSDWEGHVFGFGYGTGEEHIIPALFQLFHNLKDDRTYDYQELEQMFKPLSAWLLINVLCRADIFEYGTSPRFGWLTSKGERLRDFVKSKNIEQLYELANRDSDYTPCYPDACNCGESGESGYEEGRICQNPFWRNLK